MASRIGGALAQWLAPAFGSGLTLAVDTDKVEALSLDCAALWERVTKAPFLTVNEKRAATGYGAVAGGDVFVVRNPLSANDPTRIFCAIELREVAMPTEAIFEAGRSRHTILD